jgi:hypothetical protein
MKLHFVKNELLGIDNRDLLNGLVYDAYNSSDTSTISSFVDVKKKLDSGTAFIQESSGRVIMDITDIVPKEIIDGLIDYVDSLGHKVIRVESMFSRYSREFGIPRLTPHFDIGDPSITIDYQIKSNVTWPIAVDGIMYNLIDNDALVMHSSNTVHWRPPQIILDKEYVDMIFFRFIIESNEMSTNEKRLIAYKYYQEYKEEFIRVHGEII